MDPSLRTLIEQAEFKESFRGYDRTQVDEVLERLAGHAGRLDTELAEANESAAKAQERARAELEGEVEGRVQAELKARQVAGAEGGPDEHERAEEVRLTLVMAQRTADAAIREARAKAEKLLAAAREEADSMLADARAATSRERQDSRKQLAAEIRDLEDVRTTLQADIDALEEHIGTQRDQVSGAIEQLRQILDDPEAFRADAPPPWTEVTMPDGIEDTEQEAATGSGPAAADVSVPGAHEDGAAGTQAAGASAFGGVPPATGGDVVSGRPEPAIIDLGISEPVGRPARAEEQPTAARPSIDVADDEDGFLTELRRAMTDDDSLGSRNPADRDADQGTDRQNRSKARFRKR